MWKLGEEKKHLVTIHVYARKEKGETGEEIYVNERIREHDKVRRDWRRIG